MAVTLKTPTYSFMQIGAGELDAGCVPDVNICLPVQALTDLSFQVMALVDKADQAWFEQIDEAHSGEGVVTKQTIMAMICHECTNDEDNFFTNAPSFTGTWTKIEDGVSGPDIWIGNFTFNGHDDLFNAIPLGFCFNLCFYRVYLTTDFVGAISISFVNTTLIACTDVCFQKIDDACYTSLFTYKCYENSFDFDYANDFINKVRLPCYLRNMQLPSEEKSYIKSDGSKIKLYERIEEEYDLIIDWIPKEWHKKLKVLLAHDYITIDNTNDAPVSNAKIICREKYEITWPDLPWNWKTAPAQTKVVRSESLSLINTNCN